MAAFILPHISGGASHFSTLPVEIRVMVYHCVFRGTNLLTETIFNSRKQVDPSRISKITSILRVNRQCHAEALPLLYHHATFTMRNVVEWPIAAFNQSMSPWTGPTTARIQHLVITRSSPNGRVRSFDKLFPSLSEIEIELFGSPVGKLSLSPPPKAKINLATTVLMLYDQMCKRDLYVMKAQPFNGMLFNVTEDQRDWWIIAALWRRIKYGEGKDQYNMVLKVDLTDAIPWVKKRYGATSAARCSSGVSIAGYYQPVGEWWSFKVNGRCIIVPEPVEHSWWEGMDKIKFVPGGLLV